jgi:LAS superfamily LD-carboxypeptidase LdcB
VNALELTGRARTHVVPVADPEATLHADVVAPFRSMRRAALREGLDIVPLSSFRDFDRQLTIWNAKYAGTRPVLDAGGEPVDVAVLAPEQRIAAILRWSALPGASRHHWGTDLDLIDRSACGPAYQVRLTPDEYAPGGPFARLAQWLDAHAGRYGFFRPYRGLRSGVQAEPWHFSFAPAAEGALRRLTRGVLAAAVDSAPLLGKEHVLERLDELHARYVAAIDLP